MIRIQKNSPNPLGLLILFFQEDKRGTHCSPEELVGQHGVVVVLVVQLQDLDEVVEAALVLGILAGLRLSVGRYTSDVNCAMCLLIFKLWLHFLHYSSVTYASSLSLDSILLA